MTNEPKKILDITEREARRLRLYVVGRKHAAIFVQNHISPGILSKV